MLTDRGRHWLRKLNKTNAKHTSSSLQAVKTVKAVNIKILV